MFPINGFVFDIEADNLLPSATKIWIINIKDINTDERLVLYPFREKDCKKRFLKFIRKYKKPLIAGHNILGYDMLMLLKHLGIKFSVGPDMIEGEEVVFCDTYALSSFLYPDRPKHSLEYFGEILGFPKVDFHDFSQYSELMDHYCGIDVDLNVKVLFYLWESFIKYYEHGKKDHFWPVSFRANQKNFFLMNLQEITGWKFDRANAVKVQQQIKEVMDGIEVEILPQLPPRRLKKTEEKEYRFPKKPFKGDGSLSATMLKWIEKHNAVLLEGNQVEVYGKVYQILGEQDLDVELPMSLSNQDDLKEWLLEQGWEPSFWNVKRGKDGKPERVNGKLINTSPKLQEQGQICPNLLEMDGELIRPIVKWLSLRNRHAVIDTWINHPRLLVDGRLPTGKSGLAATHRWKHREVVNVPKAEEKVLFGKEFRALFICDDDKVIAAADAAGLEARCEGHWIWDYDGGVLATEIIEGDLHSKNAKVFYPKETEAFDITAEDFDKDDPTFKPYRSKSKNGKYALSYGCGVEKLAKTLGISYARAQIAYDAFWLANWPLARMKERLTKFWEVKGQKKFIRSIDDRVIFTRSKSALINTLFQSTGAIAMEYALNFMDAWLGGIQWDENFKPHYIYKGYRVERIGFFHDEVEYECDPAIAKEVGELVVKAIEKAGKVLKFRVPLTGEAKIGKNWKETH